MLVAVSAAFSWHAPHTVMRPPSPVAQRALSLLSSLDDQDSAESEQGGVGVSSALESLRESIAMRDLALSRLYGEAGAAPAKAPAPSTTFVRVARRAARVCALLCGVY